MTADNDQELNKIKQRRLQRLREQAAHYGKATEPHILNEIEDLEKELGIRSSASSPPDETGQIANQGDQIKPGQKPMSINWGLTLTIIAIVVTIIGIIVGLFQIFGPASQAEDFSYQVRVVEAQTGDPIGQAEVSIDVAELAPLTDVTDSEGHARITVPASHVEKPGRLMVEAANYKRYERNIDLYPDRLPAVIQLEPETVSQ